MLTNNDRQALKSTIKILEKLLQEEAVEVAGVSTLAPEQGNKKRLSQIVNRAKNKRLKKIFK